MPGGGGTSASSSPIFVGISLCVSDSTAGSVWAAFSYEGDALPTGLSASLASASAALVAAEDDLTAELSGVCAGVAADVLGEAVSFSEIGSSVVAAGFDTTTG